MTKRIFIAVKIDPDASLMKIFNTLRTGLKDERIKWTETRNLHITLSFLGDTETGRIGSIDGMLHNIAGSLEPFVISVRGAGLFRNIKDPRVIWLGIEPSVGMENLFTAVREGLKNTGINSGDGRFTPHLTLGRIKGIRNTDVLRKLVTEYSAVEIQRQDINEVILYESILLPAGPVYRAIGKYKLGQGTEQ
jgi:2'-5' RNA ligase